MIDTDYERWSEVPTTEQYAMPHRREPEPALIVNRWGDTAADQKRRRRDLVEAMRERR